MTTRTLAWLVMAFLALGVAVYAGGLMFVPEARPSFVAAHVAERPVAIFPHFLGGSIALVAGALQMSSRLRNRYIGTHRWLGRLYMVAVLMGGAAGFVLAPHSMGGMIAHVGFGLLAVCWLGSTLAAYRHIRQGRLGAHRRWMIRGYALTLAAVTLRIYLPSSLVAGIPMDVAYPAIAWLCWVPNLLVAEWFIRSRRSFATVPEASFEPEPVRGAA